jgi:hypothetical protein
MPQQAKVDPKVTRPASEESGSGGIPIMTLRRSFAHHTAPLIAAALFAALATHVSSARGSTIPELSLPGPASSARQSIASAAHGENRCSSFKRERLYAGYYVNSEKSWNIMALPADAGANATPICTITYDGMNNVGGIADDANGKLWVSLSGSASIIAFPHAQNSSAPPIQTIQGSNTLIVGLPSALSQGISFDSAGDVWVPCWWGYNGSTGYVAAFGNNANGNVAPIFTIGYGDKGAGESIAAPVATAFDREGDLYVAEYSIPGKVVVFAPPFKDKSRPIAIWTLPAQTAANYLAVDKYDNVYVGWQYSYSVFHHGLKSNGIVSRTVQLAYDAYDIKVNPEGAVYDALISAGPSDQIAIAVLPPHARMYADPRYITSSYFTNGSLGPIALGL